MKILLVYPQYPETFWSYKHALKFISKKATDPPLGLVTVAAMLPETWEKKLVDMNIGKLHDKDLKWADYVFISAMSVQRQSAVEIIDRCKKMAIKTVAGGPLFTAFAEDFPEVDHLVLNEAEATLPAFLSDLEAGTAKHIYRSEEYPIITETPVPLWELVKMKKYASMNIQYSRGCPYNCDFCDVTTLFGRKVRTKSKPQVLAELEYLYSLGWRDSISFVDDNFIGNKSRLKKDILPAIIGWMKRRKYPFSFSTEATITLADDDELLKMIAEAGFSSVFIGIETSDDLSLTECGKVQNKNRDLVKNVKDIQKHGLEVKAGFIVGFDSDTTATFRKQIEFIQKSGIVTAMVGMLNAPKNTRLYKRLVKEKRLLNETTGDNTDFTTNFTPVMGYDTLVKGYQEVLKGIYSVKPYHMRVKGFLKEYKPLKHKTIDFHPYYVKALIKSIWHIGIRERGRFYYWKMFFWSLFRRPQLFPTAITFMIYGYHFRKIFGKHF